MAHNISLQPLEAPLKEPLKDLIKHRGPRSSWEAWEVHSSPPPTTSPGRSPASSWSCLSIEPERGAVTQILGRIHKVETPIPIFLGLILIYRTLRWIYFLDPPMSLSTTIIPTVVPHHKPCRQLSLLLQDPRGPLSLPISALFKVSGCSGFGRALLYACCSS